MKLFYLDLETTGVKHWRNSVHQISGCIEIDGEVKEYFDIKCQPFDRADIEPAALAVSGITVETLKTYMTFKEAYRMIIKMLSKYVNKFNKKDKFFLVGYNNASFDNHFFRAFFVQNLDDYFGSWFWANTIDVMVLATQYLMRRRQDMTNFQLKTVAAALGIKVDESKLHDATYDIDLTRWIYKIVTAGK